MNSSCDYLIFDLTNVLYKTYFAHAKNNDPDDVVGLAHHTGLMTMNSYYKKFKPKKKIIVCLDKPNNWRKEYTLSKEATTKKVYKGQRRQNMTEKQKEKFFKFINHINEFEKILKEHTTMIVLAKESLEADDLIAGTIEYLGIEDPNSSIVVLSSDQDMIQLLRFDNVTVIDINTGKERTLDQWNGDVDLFLFEKALKGDPSDNIQCALPRVRKTRIRKAYQDPFERENLMNEIWSDHNGVKYKVKDLFNENMMLIDLTRQPEEIQKLIVKTVVKEFNTKKKYNHFEFVKYLGKYQLKKISENLEYFVPMLSL